MAHHPNDPALMMVSLWTSYTVIFVLHYGRNFPILSKIYVDFLSYKSVKSDLASSKFTFCIVFVISKQKMTLVDLE